MSQVTEKLLTAEEFLEWGDLPENQDGLWELERGRIVEMSRPSQKHCAVCWLIGLLFGKYCFDRGRGYVLTNDSGLVVEREPDTVRGPDLMYIDEEREVDDLVAKWTEYVPRLIIEVLSPNDRTTKTNVRIVEYLKHGVPLVWLVDPELHCVSVYRPEQLLQVLDNSDELIDEDVLPGFRCRVSDLFRMPGKAKPAE